MRPNQKTAFGSLIPCLRKATKKDISQPNTFACPNPKCAHVVQSMWTNALPKNNEEKIDWSAPNQSFCDSFLRFNMNRHGIASENEDEEPQKIDAKVRNEASSAWSSLKKRLKRHMADTECGGEFPAQLEVKARKKRSKVDKA